MQHVLRPQPQHQGHAAHDQDDEHGGHQGACRDAPDRLPVGGLDALVEAALREALAHEGLDRFQRVERLAGEADGAGEGVLGVARGAADLASEDDQRHQHEGKGAGDHQGQLGADHRHDGQAGDEGDQVAQRDRHRGRDQGFDDLDIGGQARDHFTGADLQEETGIEAQDMGEDVLAQVGDDAFTQPRDEEIAQRRGHGHDDDDDAQQGEGIVEGRDIAGAETLVDQLPRHEGHRWHGRRRDQQEDQHEGEIDLLPQHIGHQPRQGPQVAALFAPPGLLLHLPRQFGAGRRSVFRRRVGVRLRRRIGHGSLYISCTVVGDHVRGATSRGK